MSRSLALALLLALLAVAALGRASAAPARPNVDTRPNVVVIQTDDQTLASLRSTYRDAWDNRRRTMPNTLDLIARRGIQFTNYYVSHPLCSPSRATLLTGKYAHTSGFKRNGGPTGGWEGWQNLPRMNRNLAVALNRAGYHTAHIGKFLNGYHGETWDSVDTTVPPGWDHWFSSAYGYRLYYYGTLLNVNGVAEGPFGSNGYDVLGRGTDPPECTAANLFNPAPGVSCNHSADLFSREAVKQIERPGNQPFYIQVDYHTPHGDHRSPIGPQPVSRHYDSALRARMQRMAGFNEVDVSDKPWFIREIEPMERHEIRGIYTRWQKEVESLRGVDDGVGAIIRALRRSGELANTYVFFTSDNGMFHGQHRLGRAKFLPYEPAARVPMLVRGPGIRPGIRSPELVANVDVAPTILGLTGARLPRGFDGRSMEPFWKNPGRRSRRPIVLESFVGPHEGPPSDAGTSAPAPPRNYSAIRTGRYKFIQYSRGGRELYDMRTDRAELHNRVRSPGWRPIVRRLVRDLTRWRDCRGRRCRAWNKPLPLPPRERWLRFRRARHR